MLKDCNGNTFHIYKLLFFLNIVKAKEILKNKITALEQKQQRNADIPDITNFRGDTSEWGLPEARANIMPETEKTDSDSLMTVSPVVPMEINLPLFRTHHHASENNLT